MLAQRRVGGLGGAGVRRAVGARAAARPVSPPPSPPQPPVATSAATVSAAVHRAVMRPSWQRRVRSASGHTRPVRPQAAHRSATIAGLVTAPIGAALIAEPRLGADAGLDPRTARAIGVADLVVATGLLAGRPRWPWAAARAAANVPTAAALLRTGSPAGRAVAVALAALTCVDAAAAIALRSASE